MKNYFMKNYFMKNYFMKNYFMKNYLNKTVRIKAGKFKYNEVPVKIDINMTCQIELQELNLTINS